MLFRVSTLHSSLSSRWILTQGRLISFRWKAWDQQFGLASRRSHSSDASAPNELAAASKTLEWMAQADTISLKSIAEKLSPQARNELAAMAPITTSTKIPEPHKSELRRVAINQAIPFLGFGIMDNAILIFAGDAIDSYLGVALGISTMCAAAFGNIVADVAGITFGAIIEDYCAKLGLPTPNISTAQRSLRSVRFASQAGCAAGIVVGCLIGMFPLLIIDSKKIEKKKQEAHMDELFRDFVSEAKELIGAQLTNLYLITDSPDSTTPMIKESSSPDEKKKLYFYGKNGKNAEALTVPMGRGLFAKTVMSGEVVNVADCQSHPDFIGTTWDTVVPSKDIRNMVCVPVIDSHGRVIAVIQALNKTSKGIARRDTNHSVRGGFTPTDVQVLKVLASHVAVSIQNLFQDDAELSLKQTIGILKDQGLAGLPEDGPSGERRLRAYLPNVP